MEKDAESEGEDGKPSSLIARYLMWLVVALLVYLLSTGPAIWLEANNNLSNESHSWLDRIYAPVGWAYESTLLHKPIGMYLHFWAPKLVDKHGDVMSPGKP